MSTWKAMVLVNCHVQTGTRKMVCPDKRKALRCRRAAQPNLYPASLTIEAHTIDATKERKFWVLLISPKVAHGMADTRFTEKSVNSHRPIDRDTSHLLQYPSRLLDTSGTWQTLTLRQLENQSDGRLNFISQPRALLISTAPIKNTAMPALQMVALSVEILETISWGLQY
ncbi:hypothetical protein SAMD00023353_4001140 [Rosellinia necatrix]|uniref:Uncharacterized protein n=1 Tax=Rosellinia necatrix TaxID=77044 RepID=A0A1W2TMA4_ROSNE|nr:hypothetical protein SAMD00023353_4001140 [Rosellinia necatrix]